MITKTVAIKLSGKDLADEFWELGCQEQADFFNKTDLLKTILITDMLYFKLTV